MDTKRNNKSEEVRDRLIQYLRQREKQRPSGMRENVKDEIWSRVAKEHSKKRMRLVYRRWSVAVASVAAVIVLAVVFYPGDDWSQYPVSDISRFKVIASASHNSNDIQLIVPGSGEIVVDVEDKKIVHSNDGMVCVGDKAMNVSSESAKGKQEEMIQLWVPYGKHIQLELADGSVLDVNAGTRVIYPKTFRKDCREIYVEGEIFIDVQHTHNVPFIVHTNHYDVNVLGTAFNIMAYKDEMQSEIVLLRGKVEVKDQKEQRYLMKPDEKVSFNGTMYAGKEKVDASEYVAWKNGLFILKGEPLNHVLERLTRYYNRKIECDPVLSASIPIYGKIDVNESLEDVLTSIALTSGVEWKKLGSSYQLLRKQRLDNKND